MSSNDLCGSSNALKGFSQHVNQDRSRQQDRVVQGPKGNTETFRSTANSAANASAQPNGGINFGAFQAGQAPLPLSGHGGPGLNLPAPSVPGRVMQNRAPGPLHQPSLPAIPRQGPVHGANWVQEFGAMNLGPSAAQANGVALPGPHIQRPVRAPMPAVHPMQFYPPVHHFQGPVNMWPPAHGPAFVHPSQAAVEQTRRQYEADFNDEMEKWMVLNGPLLQPTSTSAVTSTNEPVDGTDVAFASEDIVKQPAAAESEASPASKEENDTELARAAQEIVDSMSGDSNSKFESSAFYKMMQRIASREVVVEGNDLVESSTNG
ncbi:hypothetical protein F4778DRAFT_535852 [Xylariomycetidae sp. FL2044]|nr:hypothetical protein F4778DRAFT_535852 [Xylariomycetidae sp. FL2044]